VRSVDNDEQHELVFLSQRRQCAAAPCLEPQAQYRRGIRRWQKFCEYHSTSAGWREWQAAPR
jgi:hypothetical protein